MAHVWCTGQPGKRTDRSIYCRCCSYWQFLLVSPDHTCISFVKYWSRGCKFLTFHCLTVILDIFGAGNSLCVHNTLTNAVWLQLCVCSDLFRFHPVCLLTSLCLIWCCVSQFELVYMISATAYKTDFSLKLFVLIIVDLSVWDFRYLCHW